MKSLVVIVVAMLSGGCEQLACPAIYAFPLTVQAVDSTKGTAVSAGLQGDLRQGATVVATATAPAGGSILNFVDAIPIGTYDLNVRATGYLDWRTSGVVIAKGKCGIYVQQSLMARLRVVGS
jgi:hypothetical protein